MNKKRKIVYIISGIVVLIGALFFYYFDLTGNFADASRGQKRIQRVISVDLKPGDSRVGEPGDRITYIAKIKNLQSRRNGSPSTWNISARLEPSAPGLSIEPSIPSVTLDPQKSVNYEVYITVDENAIPGQEVQVTLDVTEQGGNRELTVQRYFTVKGGKKRPR